MQMQKPERQAAGTKGAMQPAEAPVLPACRPRHGDIVILVFLHNNTNKPLEYLLPLMYVDVGGFIRLGNNQGHATSTTLMCVTYPGKPPFSR